jgi:hypothetical protein
MYDAFAEEYLEHARDGAYNAYYDRPAVLSVLGGVRGLAVPDRGCTPRNWWPGARPGSSAWMAAPPWCGWPPSA